MSARRASGMTVTKLGDAVGAEITGIDRCERCSAQAARVENSSSAWRTTIESKKLDSVRTPSAIDSPLANEEVLMSETSVLTAPSLSAPAMKD